MIRLFLTDIDGCLAEPYRAFDLDGFRRLREWADLAERDPSRPRLGICSGRSYGYVEATAQALGLSGPALFESGGGRLDLPGGRIRWNPALTPALEAQLDAVRAFYRDELVPRGGFEIDYGKRAQAGVVSLNPRALAHALAETEALVAERFPDLMVAPTPVSIDVLPRALSKAEAVAAVAWEEGLDLEEVAFIGDTRGDLGALEIVGVSFAPANAEPEVLEAVDVVTGGAALEGLLEAYTWCMAHNQALLLAA
jgi:hydroxymethylpyrimidine pyrophosphatase-like HAD family hydrolase